MTFFSKSKYLSGLQCSKLLWYYYNAREEIPPPDEAAQAVFDQGHEVGEIAKSLFPGGIEVARGIVDVERVLPESLEALRLRKPHFEAGFRYRNAFARADVLNPVGGDRWDIIEVKSSTEVKEINLHDMALQRYTYEGAGLKIRKCVLMYIDTAYVRRGPVEPEKLFTEEDVTAQVSGLMSQVESNLDSMGDVIRLKKHPDIPIGPQCDDPYTCPLHGMCWKFLPEHNVFTLNRLGRKAFGLLGRGVMTIADIPEDYKLTGNQRIQRESVRNRRTMIDGRAIAAFLKCLTHPLCFLDFETFGTAIPLFDGIRPYQQIPFQFSLHIVRAEGGGAEHHSFLAEGDADPRPELLASLRKLLVPGVRLSATTLLSSGVASKSPARRFLSSRLGGKRPPPASSISMRRSVRSITITRTSRGVPQ